MPRVPGMLPCYDAHMRSLAPLAAMPLAAMLLACSGSAGGDSDQLLVFTDWIPIEASCGDYSFRGPPDMRAQPAQGIDSCVERWTTSSCDYASDYGGFSSDLSEYREAMDYQEREETISGRAAKLVTATFDSEPRYLAAITIPDVDRARMGLRLTLGASCRSSAGQEDALSVFRSLVLPE